METTFATIDVTSIDVMVADLTAGCTFTATAALVLAGLCGAGLWRIHARLLGTTLVVPWCWAVAALAAVTGFEAVLGFGAASWPPSSGDSLRYAVACLSCCPMVAVLGAKRPQLHVWHLVVVSLWAAIALPSAGAIPSPGAPLEIDLARAWLLAVVIAFGCANWLPTRYWLAAILAAAGQTVLLAEALPLGVPGWGALGVLLCLALWAGAAFVAVLARRPRCDDRLDLLWRDFRDSYGATWALRIAERVNAAAVQHDWPVRLAWRGFLWQKKPPTETSRDARASTVPPSPQDAVRGNLTGLVRRFVSAQWIAARLDESID